MPRQCSVEGCELPHDSHGFCGKHAQRWRRGQRLDRDRFLYRGARCCIAGCDAAAVTGGMCGKHYQRRQNGRPLDGPDQPPRWTEADDRQVLALIVPGRKRVHNGDTEAVAARLGRSVIAVRSRLHRLRAAGVA